MLSKPLYAQDIRKLDNGLRLIIKEDHRNPLVVFSVFIDAGAASEGTYSGSGISHLIEHMLFKGTKKYPPGAIENILHTYGGRINGATSHDYTGFRITILKEHAGIALDILEEMFSSPRFDPAELKKEMQVIEREMDMVKDDPGRRISRLIFSNAYIRHPYRIPVIGYKEIFQGLKRDDLVSFFNSYYTPERIIIAVVGDIDKETILDEAVNRFGKMQRGKTALIALPEEPMQAAGSFSEERMDIEGAYLNIAFHSTSLLNNDLYALDLLSFILGQGESSILNEEIRLKKKLILSISAYNWTPKEPGLFIISSTLKEGNVKDTIDEIIKHMDIVKEEGVPEEAMIRAKNNFLAGYIYQKETIQSTADDLALSELLTGNPRFFELYIERIKSVTLNDIREAAKRYLTRENMTVVVISKSGDTLNLVRETPLQKRERILKKTTLENKLPVLISEDTSLPVLSIALLFKGGVRLETRDNNGISKLTSLMYLDGTDSMTRKEIAGFYESKGMSLNTYAGNNSLGISVTCLKERVEDALMLVSDLSTNPVFPEDELDREKSELTTLIHMQDNQLFNHGHRLLKELLFNVHPYRFQTIGTHATIEKIHRDDILQFHRNILSADNMVLGISGDCNTEEIKGAIERYFSNIPLRKIEYPVPEREPAIEKVREQILDTGREQSLVLLGFHGIDIYSKDRYAVEIMVDALSSESGILFKNIREKKGLSYATGAFQASGIDPGYIAIYALTSKENIGRVKNILFREISSFIAKGISEEELQKSKNHLKAMRHMASQTNSSFIFTASLDELYGLGYDSYKDYDKKIDSVGRDDIKKVAGELLTLDKCAILILKGKE